jgi:hypothetical protein
MNGRWPVAPRRSSRDLAEALAGGGATAVRGAAEITADGTTVRADALPGEAGNVLTGRASVGAAAAEPLVGLDVAASPVAAGETAAAAAPTAAAALVFAAAYCLCRGVPSVGAEADAQGTGQPAQRGAPARRRSIQGLYNSIET